MRPARALKIAARAAMYWSTRLGLRLRDLGTGRTATIVRYHSVSETAGGNHRYVSPAVAVRPAAFAQHIALLARHYRCVPMDALREALDGGSPLPPNAVVITFDDGYRDNYDVAYPILRHHRVPAIFYVTTGCLDGGPALWTTEIRHLVYGAGRRAIVDPLSGRTHDVTTPGGCEQAIRGLKGSLVVLPAEARQRALAELRAQSDADAAAARMYMLTWAQVREMHRGGMHFGAHTVTHPRLPSMPDREAYLEIAESRAQLESRLGIAVEHFAYPNPGDGAHWSPSVRGFVSASGFATAVTSEARYVDGADDALTLGRVPPSPDGRALAWDLERDALSSSLGDEPSRPEAAPRTLDMPAVERPSLGWLLDAHAGALASLQQQLTPLNKVDGQPGAEPVGGTAC